MDEGAFSRAICAERLFLLKWVRAKFKLCTADAEDFVQDTLCKAWVHRDRYDDQQKMRAWLMMILVHLVLSHKRRAWRVHLTDDMAPFDTGIPGNQFDALYLKEVLAKMVQLSPEQLDALIFVARGEQYDETAEITQAACGTVKSRVARARAALKEALDEGVD